MLQFFLMLYLTLIPNIIIHSIDYTGSSCNRHVNFAVARAALTLVDVYNPSYLGFKNCRVLKLWAHKLARVTYLVIVLNALNFYNCYFYYNGLRETANTFWSIIGFHNWQVCFNIFYSPILWRHLYTNHFIFKRWLTGF